MARAKFGYQLVSEDRTKEGVKSAQAGLKNLEGSMKDVNKIAATLMGAGAIAGVTMALRKLYQGAAEAEKAFAAMHPETQKARGSLEDWNRAMANLKAQGGSVVAGVMTPIRAAFLNLIDPIGSATRELSKLNDELGKISERYTSTGTKQFENMKAAQEALAKAATTNKDAQSELNEVLRQQSALQKQKPSTALPESLPAGMDPMQWLSMQEMKLAQWEQSMQILRERANLLSRAISETAYQMKEIPKWIAENTKKGTTSAAGAVAAAGPAWAYENPFMDISEMQKYIEERRKSEWRGFFGDVTGLGQSGAGAAAGETDWFMEQRANALGAASEARNPLDAIGPLSEALGFLGGQFSSVAMLMDPLKIVFQSMMQVLTPIVDSVLSPLIGALSIVGTALGQILAPVIQALSPVIEVVSKAFVWLYNNVIVPMGNGIWALFSNIGNTIKWVIDKIVALGTTIWYIVSFQWGKLGSVDWGGALPSRVTAQEGPLSAITTGDLSAAGSAYQSSTTGSSASYSQARPITVNVVVNSEVITGETGGFRELAIKLENEIQAVLALGLA